MRGSRRKPSEASTIAELLPKVLRQRGLTADYYRYKIFDLWRIASGKQIADQTEPKSLDRGVFTVAVTNSVWLQELQFMKRDLVDRLNRELDILRGTDDEQLELHLPRVKDLRLVIGKVSKPANVVSQTPRTRLALPPPSAEDQVWAERETAQTKDSELREILKSALLKAKARRRSN